MKNTRIISAFPGTGKSYIYKNQEKFGLSILDSDSSKFDKTEFPQNYFNHIKENIGKVDIIFVSSHKIVRDSLLTENIKFNLIFPDISLCSEYCQRYIDRGSSGTFIKTIIDNWDVWIKDCISSPTPNIQLGSNIYISNVLGKLYNQWEMENISKEIIELESKIYNQ